MKSGRNRYALIIFLCWLAYSTAYIGRLGYTANMPAILADTGRTKAAVGIVSAAMFFCYGIGQLVNGILCRRYNHRYIIFGALLASAVFNFIMPFCPSVAAMTVVWGLNGAAQSMLWCCIVSIESDYMPKEKMSKAIVAISTTAGVGTLLTYGIAAVCATSWRLAFYIGPAILVIVAAVWLFGTSVLKTTPKADMETETRIITSNGLAGKNNAAKLLYFFMPLFFIVCMANGLIRDGMTAWFPSLVHETFGVPVSLSIVITLALPLIGMTGALINSVAAKAIKNHLIIALLCYAGAVPIILLLFMTYSKYLALTAVSFALVRLTMAIVNNVMLSVIPLQVRAFTKAGRLSAIMDTFCYMGSAAAIYGLGALTDSSGWDAVIKLLLIITAAVCAALIFGAVRWQKKVMLMFKETGLL